MIDLRVGQPLEWTQSHTVHIVKTIYNAINTTGRALYQVKNQEDGLQYAMKVFDDSLNDSRAIHTELVALNRQVQLPSLLPRFRSIFARQGFTYIFMDWMDGDTFDDVTKREPALDRESFSLRVAMIVEMAKTIERIHQARFIHRDIKPQNMLLRNRRSPRDGVAVIDFGSSAVKRVLEEGTLDYQSPEQAGRRDFNLSPATDVFGMGQVGWFLFTGAPLLRFPNDTVTDWAGGLDCRLSANESRIPGTDELQGVLLKSMNYNPKNRYQDSSQFKAAVMNVQRKYFS